MDFEKRIINFVLACRWVFPSDYGGIAMHNYNLAQILTDIMHISLIPHGSEDDTPLVSNTLFRYLAKGGFIKNGLRSFEDWRISTIIAKKLEFGSPDLIEFMDIHSDGYVYLKRNPKKNRKTKVIIRSHTPWGLLRL